MKRTGYSFSTFRGSMKLVYRFAVFFKTPTLKNLSIYLSIYLNQFYGFPVA